MDRFTNLIFGTADFSARTFQAFRRKRSAAFQLSRFGNSSRLPLSGHRRLTPRRTYIAQFDRSAQFNSRQFRVVVDGPGGGGEDGVDVRLDDLSGVLAFVSWMRAGWRHYSLRPWLKPNHLSFTAL